MTTSLSTSHCCWDAAAPIFGRACGSLVHGAPTPSARAVDRLDFAAAVHQAVNGVITAAREPEMPVPSAREGDKPALPQRANS